MKEFMTAFIKKLFPVVLLVLIISIQTHADEDKNMFSEQASDIKITILYDNNSYQTGLKSAWGFSCLITGLKKSILFDTGGDGALFMENIKKLGIDPRAVDVIFLSHNHWDHTGGILDFLRENSDVTVYLLESFPESFVRDVENQGARVIKIEQSVHLFDNVYSTGQLGTSIKEQSLVIDTEKGLIIITGCAHPGIVQIVETTKQILYREVLFVLGGFHLCGEKRKTIDEIVGHLKNLNVGYVAPCHCSGEQARTIFEQKFNGHFVDIGLGKTINIDELR
jgi:7,8-dihydropterin-6-yl-methyl-4-(beta-D-ribofuranosyl)aminobenzene 5'-phosphate synthase